MINRRRMVAIEFGIWRSGRKGGTSGSIIDGYDKLREQRGGTRSIGGNVSPLLKGLGLGQCPLLGASAFYIGGLVMVYAVLAILAILGAPVAKGADLEALVATE